MKSIVKQGIIYSMVGMMQIGLGGSVIEASPLYNEPVPMQQEYDRDQGRHEGDRFEHDRHERERIENERHEREMKRRPHETRKHWNERKKHEIERHERELYEMRHRR